MTDEQATRLETFAARRREAALSPQGSLSLINTHWVTEPAEVWGAPGRWFPRTDGGSGLRVEASADDGITIDGSLVEGEGVARGKDDPEPSDIRFSDTVTASVISGTEGYGLQVFDQKSDDATRFSHIDRYDFDPSWVIQATWEEIPGGSLMGFQRLKDDGSARDEVVPGDIVMEHGGETYTLSAFKAGKALQLVFADATSGVDTYSVGRFLFLVPNPDGSITLDFNYAVLPPCAFSYQYNCPLPPKNNRLPVAITAGEKMVMAADEPLHPE